ncbi:MAG: hypothetical protein LBC76_06670, partial [Treponema sp.]|nr:hypothetical protein [Treponema sp.]
MGKIWRINQSVIVIDYNTLIIYHNFMKNIYIFTVILCLTFFSCTKHEEFSADELETMGAQGLAEILAKTTSKPWRGEEFLPGKLGGTWYTTMSEDPKSFNNLIAEQD